jgi:HlyD family secretion protein
MWIVNMDNREAFMSAPDTKRSKDAQLRVVSDSTKQPELSDILGKESLRRRYFSGRFLLWSLIALVLALAAYGTWIYLGQGARYVYATAAATRDDLTVVVAATGTVQPLAQVDVSTAISGVIRKINVDYNSVVKTGEVLAELDTDTLQATLSAARARLAVAEANVVKIAISLESARASYDRQFTLFERRVSSVRDLEAAQSNLDSASATLRAAEAEVEAAKADLRLAEINLGHAYITSPIDGVVLSRNVSEGSTVAAALQAPILFSIAGDLTDMEVQVDVDEADVGAVTEGQKATFTVDAYRDLTFPAEITDIRFVSETINNVVTYKALLQVDNTNLLLRPGMTATADIVVKTVDAALLVPNAALRYTPPQESGGGFLFFPSPNMGAVTSAEKSGGVRTIWVLRGATPTPIDIEVGATDGQYTEVLSGDIKEGDEVVTDAVAAN